MSYKIISKALAARMRRILPFVIDEIQSAFVKDRLITDNMIVAHETFHWLNQRKGAQEKYFGLKLDMNKALTGWNGSFWNTCCIKLVPTTSLQKDNGISSHQWKGFGTISTFKGTMPWGSPIPVSLHYMLRGAYSSNQKSRNPRLVEWDKNGKSRAYDKPPTLC